LISVESNLCAFAFFAIDIDEDLRLRDAEAAEKAGNLRVLAALEGRFALSRRGCAIRAAGGPGLELKAAGAAQAIDGRRAIDAMRASSPRESGPRSFARSPGR